MSTRMKIAFGCYFMNSFVLFFLGIIYLFRGEFMPYHSVAVGMLWSDVPSNFKVLILALMKAIGGAYAALALAQYLILFVPFRQGSHWAICALPLLIIAQCMIALYPICYVALNTSATPPYMVPLAGILVSVIACALSFSGSKEQEIGDEIGG